MASDNKKYDDRVIEVAKNQIDCRDLVRKLATKVTDHGHYLACCCLFHDDSDPSMSVRKNDFRCFGCDAKGDVITLIHSINKGKFDANVTGKDFIEACEYLNITPAEELPEIRIKEKSLETGELEELFNAALTSKNKAYEYLRSRHIIKKPINIGFLSKITSVKYHHKYPFLANYDWLCTPMYKEENGELLEEIVGLNLRNIDSEDKKIKHRKIGQTGLYQPLFNDIDSFIPLNATVGCESSTDAIVMSTPATATFGISNLERYSFKSIACDNDKAGLNVASKGGALTIFDGTDPATSKEFATVSVDLVDIEEKIAAILLFEKDISIIDLLLKSAFEARHYNEVVAAAFTLIDAMKTRSMQNFLTELHKIHDSAFRELSMEATQANIGQLYKMMSQLPVLYSEVSKGDVRKFIVEISTLIPYRLGRKLCDKDWRAFERNIYSSQNALLAEPMKELVPFRIDGFDQIFRTAAMQALVGHSNIGKTTLSYYLMSEVIKHSDNTKILFFSLETNKKLVEQALSEYDLMDLSRVEIIESIVNLGFLEHLIAIAADEGYTHIFIDNAKIIYQDDHQALEKSIRALEVVATRKGISIMLLVQLLKSVKSEEYYYLTRHDMHGGGAIYDRCDAVIGINPYKKGATKEERKNPEACKFLHIAIMKSRIPSDHQQERSIFSFVKEAKKLFKIIVKKIDRSTKKNEEQT